LIERLGLNDAGVKVFEDVIGANSEQQQLDKEICGNSEEEPKVCVSSDVSA
jgi:hypothetical protein